MNTTPGNPCDATSLKDREYIKKALLEINEPLTESEVVDFGLAFDRELESLEARFASFVTRKSVLKSLAR